MAKFGLVIAVACASGHAIADDGQSKIDALCRRATDSSARLKTDAASWTIARPTLPRSPIVEVVRKGAESRYVVKSGAGKEICRVIARDGLWYVVDENGDAGKFRSFEATLLSPTCYSAICGARPRTPQEVLPAKELSLEGENDTSATLQGPLVEAARFMLGGMEVMVAEARKKGELDAQAKSAAAIVETMQGAGTQIVVDRETGFVSSIDCGGESFVMTDFKWLTEIPAETFDIGGKEWPDHTQPLREEKPGDCALLITAHDAEEARSSICRNLLLVNLSTGKTRRVPCQIGPTSMGCFSADRSKVFAVAMDPNVGLNRVVEVDLATGRNRDACEGMLEGMTIYPAISQDGKKLSVLNCSKGMRFDHTQLCIIDLATRKVTKVGSPGNYISPRWLPNDDFCLIQNKPEQQEQQKVLCHLSHAGELKELRPSAVARPLGKEPKIVCADFGMWIVCGLDGKLERELSDKLFDLRMIEPSIDGKRALLLKADAGRGYFAPHIADLESGELTKVPLGFGYWQTADW
jgi:hypothetical protein